MDEPKEVEPCAEAFLSRPVLVYGPRKAGTTLLQSMLDGGSGLLMLPDELKLKYAVRKNWPGGTSPAHWFVAKGRSFFPELFELAADDETVRVKPDSSFAGLSREQLTEIIDLERYSAGLTEILRRNPAELSEIIRSDVRAFTGALKTGRGKAISWGSKEVGGESARILALFRELFPEGKVVYAVRQPEFIVRSILLNRRRSGKRMSIRAVLHECRDAQNVINYGYEQLLGKKAVVVAYEKLTENPKKVIEGVCRELGLNCEPVNEGPTTLGRPVVVITSSRQTTEVFRQAADWKKDLTALQVGLIRLFQLFGPLFYRLQGKRMVPYGRLKEAMEGGNG